MSKDLTHRLEKYDLEFKTLPGVFSYHGLDYGTELLLDKLDILDNTLVADLGCGVGVIGLVVAKRDFNGHVHLLDDNLRAVNLASENVELNKLKNAEVFLSDLFSAVPGRTYHQIISNPPASMGNDFLEELISESFNHLKTEGWLWLVVTKNIRPLIERLLQSRFNNYIILAQGRDHVVIKSQRKN